MTIEEVMKLIDAGYTKEDIQGFMQPAAEPEPAPAAEPAKTAVQETGTADNAVLKELQELRKAVKAMTIVTGAAEKPASNTVDDVLKKLV